MSGFDVVLKDFVFIYVTKTHVYDCKQTEAEVSQSQKSAEKDSLLRNKLFFFFFLT